MERRDFLKIFSIGTVAAMSGQIAHRTVGNTGGLPLTGGYLEDVNTSAHELASSIEYMSTPAPRAADFLQAFTGEAILEGADTGDDGFPQQGTVPR